MQPLPLTLHGCAFANPPPPPALTPDPLPPPRRAQLTHLRFPRPPPPCAELRTAHPTSPPAARGSAPVGDGGTPSCAPPKKRCQAAVPSPAGIFFLFYMYIYLFSPPRFFLSRRRAQVPGGGWGGDGRRTPLTPTPIPPLPCAAAAGAGGGPAFPRPPSPPLPWGHRALSRPVRARGRRRAAPAPAAPPSSPPPPPRHPGLHTPKIPPLLQDIPLLQNTPPLFFSRPFLLSSVSPKRSICKHQTPYGAEGRKQNWDCFFLPCTPLAKGGTVLGRKGDRTPESRCMVMM